jgi:Protein of unknown function (DUF2934)
MSGKYSCGQPVNSMLELRGERLYLRSRGGVVTPKKQETDVVRVRPRADRRLKKRSVPAETEIAARAYQLFLQRGGQHGHDWEDWLTAERELQVPAR